MAASPNGFWKMPLPPLSRRSSVGGKTKVNSPKLRAHWEKPSFLPTRKWSVLFLYLLALLLTVPCARGPRGRKAYCEIIEIIKFYIMKQQLMQQTGVWFTGDVYTKEVGSAWCPKAKRHRPLSSSLPSSSINSCQKSCLLGASCIYFFFPTE